MRTRKHGSESRKVCVRLQYESTRQTPFEMMFGRKPKIPIDIVLPNTEKHDREPILKEFNIIDDALGEITVLEDHSDLPKTIVPEMAKNYLINLRDRLEDSFRKAAKNRNIAMESSKMYYDRKIKKFSYEVVDFVLVDHPHLKKDLSRVIAHKYYGPFTSFIKTDSKRQNLV